MWVRFLSFVLLCNSVFAVSQGTVAQNLNSLMGKINQVNQDLEKKQQQQKNLNNAISDSNAALGESVKILSNLRQTRSLDVEQLNEIATVLPQIESLTKQTQDHVKATITTIYQQIKIVQLDSNSVISGNDTLQNNRKQYYLTELLKSEMIKYQQLQAKLDQLIKLNNKLQIEVDRLNKQLGVTAEKADQLKEDQQDKIEKQKLLQEQIALEKEQLSGLKQKQVELNHLMYSLNKATKSSSVAPKTQAHTNPPSGSVNQQQVAENLDDSPFFGRKLAKPLNGKVAIPFGDMHHGVRNNGVVYNKINAAVFAISDGKIIYDGELPGFGKVVVINHGDNYMSVYGGVVPIVHKGQIVNVGQVIANSGSHANQPMGGVYFELRHYGQPVNPQELVD